MPDLSFPELFDIAVIDTKTAISESERFFGSDYSSSISSSFFSENSLHFQFFRESVNLDTGKPSALNEDIRKLKNPSPSQILEPGLDNLVERYDAALRT